MDDVITKPTTLRQMREAKNLTAEQAAPLIAEKLGRVSYHFSSVLKAEAEGVFDVRILRAYAAVYDVTLIEVMEVLGLS